MKVSNWSKYQSYKDRKPPWIRFHRSMIDNYEYQMMSAEARALLPMLWLLACEHEDPTSGIIDLEPKVIAYRLRRDEKEILESVGELVCAGFIDCNEIDTEPLRECNETVPEFRKNVTTETETETETEYIWEPDQETKTACEIYGIKINDQMIATFGLKVLDWRDNGFTSVKLRNKFVSHCKEMQNTTVARRPIEKQEDNTCGKCGAGFNTRHHQESCA